LGCGSAVLAKIAMLQPSAAKRLAIAKPMPRLPPEMIARLPSNDVISNSFGQFEEFMFSPWVCNLAQNRCPVTAGR